MYLRCRYHNIIFTVALCFSATASQAQNDCGCKEGEQYRATIGMHFNSGRLDSAEFYIKKFLTFKEKGCRINYNGAMAQVAMAKKEYGSAREYLEAEKKLLETNACNPGLYVRHYSTLAKLYQELNQLDSVVSTCLKGIDAAEKANDNYGLSRANTDLAAVFAAMEQHPDAIFYYRRGMEAAKKQTTSPVLTALVQSRLSAEYLSLFKNTQQHIYADSAAMLAKEALDTAAKYHDLLAYLEANETLAAHAVLTGNYKAALPYADVIINNSPRGVHLLDRLTYAGFSKKSEALYQLKNFAAAEQFADSALLYAQAFNPQMMVSAYDKIYQAAKANNNIAKSLSAHEKMTALNDSLFTLQKNTAISELEKKYNQAKNEKTINELAQQKQLYLLLALAGLLGLGLLGFVIRQQSLKNKQKILETEQRLNRARINPHFFFNALSSLQSLALIENDGRALAVNLSRFSHIMRQTLESTYKDYVTIGQEKDFLNEYLELQKMRFPQKFTYAISIAGDVEPDDMFIPSMILQPFAENSIEHGFTGIDHAGHIAIHFEKKENNLAVTITDNGKGLPVMADTGSGHISRASQIIKDRIYLLNAKLKTRAGFTIHNNPGNNGVQVNIVLPVLFKQDTKQ